MVLLLHVPSFGKLWDIPKENTLGYNFLWVLEAFAYSAVDIFAIISGFMCVQKKFSLGKIIKFWLQGLFYSVVSYISVCFICCSDVFSLKGAIKALLPVSTS